MFNQIIQKFKKKNLLVSFLNIQGISYHLSKKLFTMFGINFKYKNDKFIYFLQYEKDLLKNLEQIINNYDQNYFFLQENINRKFQTYIKINHYKGKRLIYNLPLNGQRTHTNSKTFRKLANLFKK
jgi:ribosomal protein S13